MQQMLVVHISQLKEGICTSKILPTCQKFALKFLEIFVNSHPLLFHKFKIHIDIITSFELLRKICCLLQLKVSSVLRNIMVLNLTENCILCADILYFHRKFHSFNMKHCAASYHGRKLDRTEVRLS